MKGTVRVIWRDGTEVVKDSTYPINFDRVEMVGDSVVIEGGLLSKVDLEVEFRFDPPLVVPKPKEED